MTFRPIITGTGLPKHKVIRPEDLTVSSRSETVHRSWLQIHKHSAWNKPSAASLIVIHINPLELQLRISSVLSSHIDTVFCTNYLPELCSDLVSALTALNMENLTHLRRCRRSELQVRVRVSTRRWL
ncbi:hypothetical protein Hanom_Chr11g01016631 [Helianthus anomalus]